MKKNTGKNGRIYIRISESEKNLIVEKAKNYPSVSAFILDACKLYDDELGVKRLERIKKWSGDYKKFEGDLSHVGNNLNQMSKYLNNLSLVGITNDNVLLECRNLLQEIESLLVDIVGSNLYIKQTASKLLKS